MSDWVILSLKVLVPFLVIFNIVPLLIWLERKGSAYIQDRVGPNRASVLGIRAGGLVHSLADVLKLLFKEDIIPNHVNRFFYVLAPFLSLTVACITFLVIPFAAPIPLENGLFHFQASTLNAGLLYILAATSLGVYGIMLGGWSSNNKYALLGGLRSSAQMVSYELSMGLALVCVILWVGSLSLGDIVEAQSSHVLNWFAVQEPIACLIFIVAAFAETNRAPFDLPESESELVAGYHVEYSSMKFAMFFMAEYANMIIASAFIATVFFGGWQVPFLSTEFLRDNASSVLRYSLMAVAGLSVIGGLFLASKFKRGRYGDKRDYEVLIFGVLGLLTAGACLLGLLFIGSLPFSEQTSLWLGALFQFGCFIGKILFMCWVFVWVRWTLPRIRYDQLMNLGWKYMLPTAMVNVVITAIRLYIKAS